MAPIQAPEHDVPTPEEDEAFQGIEKKQVPPTSSLEGLTTQFNQWTQSVLDRKHGYGHSVSTFSNKK